MEVSVSQEKIGKRPITVFKVTGDITSNTYQEFEAKARDAFDKGMKDLIVDLADCGYVSSAGIRALNSILIMLRTDDRKESDEAMNKGIRDGTWKSPHLKLVKANKRVQEVFRIAGVDMLMDVHTTMKKALESF